MSINVEKHPYVFISYSSQNQQMADSVRLMLIENNISCWMAPHDIPAGSQYAYVINDALENCSCLLLLLTNASQISQFVGREIERAVTYKKPIIPIQLEDLQLDSGFRFYIGNSQIIAVPELRADTPEFQKVLAGIRRFVSLPEEREDKSTIVNSVKEYKKTCMVKIISPVNADVFLDNKNQPVMKIDLNSGFYFQTKRIFVGKSFDLIFASKGFEKTISFEMPSNQELEFHLNSILTEAEIEASYDREEALAQIEKIPTGYAFEQIAVVGEKEDIELLERQLSVLTNNITREETDRNYLTACCAVALGKLCIKYHYDSLRIIAETYENYPGKNSYGYMFKDIIRDLEIVFGRKDSQKSGSMRIESIIEEIIDVMDILPQGLERAYIPFEIVDDNQIRILGETVRIYIANSLSDAWVKAYPDYEAEFANDKRFKEYVDAANGKWLEPKGDSDFYSILLSTSKNETTDEIMRVFVHELQHCYDFIRSLHNYHEKGKIGLPESNKQFSLWSEFNAKYTDTVISFMIDRSMCTFEGFAEYLGLSAADSVHGMIKKDNREYFLSRYLGVQRAVRDMSDIYATSPAFQVWSLTPSYIEEAFPSNFYLANDFQEMEFFVWDND